MSGRSKRYKPLKLRSGVIVPSGLDIAEKGALRPGQITRGPFRAIVMETFVPNAIDNSSGLGIECNVLLVSTRQIIYQCRVLQPGGHGVHNAAPWVPRPSSKTVSGDPISLDGSTAGQFTKLSDFDGDLVLVDFVEGDLRSPVVLGALPHEQTKRKVRSSQGQEANALDPDSNAAFAAITGGWNEDDGGASRGTAYDEEHYLAHRGTELRINRQGDVLVDTVGAYGSDDTESALSSAGGQIRLRVKTLKNLVVECDGDDVLIVHKDALGKLHVDLGDGASERLILGDTFTTHYLAHQHPTAMGLSGPPVPSAGGVDMTPPLTPHLSEISKTK